MAIPIDTMKIVEKLTNAMERANSLLCVGLDTDVRKIPDKTKAAAAVQGVHPLFAFNKEIIDATHDLVCAYKPNSAFYEAEGVAGIEALKETFDYIHSTFPEIVTIFDAKRGDIGNTNEGYCRFAFEYLGADAITLAPYMGHESLEPFLAREDKACIILCRTSNPGAGEFQDRRSQDTGTELYLDVAHQIATHWNKNENCMLVVGATYPEELERIRRLAGVMPILVPGIGAQGGDLEKTLQAGLTVEKKGLIISASRSILYAASPRQEAEHLRDEINRIRYAER